MNVTAILTLDQVRTIGEALDPRVPAIASIFAGRIADTGRDPVPVLCEARRILQDLPQTRVLWASVREAFNIAQANACGCDIVTVPHSILEKALRMWSMELDALSLDTVKMFVADAAKAGYHL